MNSHKLTNLDISTLNAIKLPVAVLGLQFLGEQMLLANGEKLAFQNKQSSSRIIAGAVRSIAVKDGGDFHSLSEICSMLRIPKTTDRLQKIIDIMQTTESDYALAYDRTTESSMNEQNRTAAYNAAKMARSRLARESSQSIESPAHVKLVSVLTAAINVILDHERTLAAGGGVTKYQELAVHLAHLNDVETSTENSVLITILEKIETSLEA